MYIHDYSCISPQHTFREKDIASIVEYTDNKLTAIEPGYADIPPGVLRRMGKAVRIGIGAAMPVIQHQSIDGIIIGTANGGMEDCIKFLNQIIDYNEGMLTPGSFVQSTPNAIAGQIGLLDKNTGYNITHVHLGLAFENALLDAFMMVREHPGTQYLVGAVDVISSYNYHIDLLKGTFRKDLISNKDLYSTTTAGTIAGEGATAFQVNDIPENAVAQIRAIKMIHTEDENEIKAALQDFLRQQVNPNGAPDLFISGENGDERLLKYYRAAESVFPDDTTIARYKHLCGDFPTASSIAVWLACYKPPLPNHCIKRPGSLRQHQSIVIYNNYYGKQHGFVYLTK